MSRVTEQKSWEKWHDLLRVIIVRIAQGAVHIETQGFYPWNIQGHAHNCTVIDCAILCLSTVVLLTLGVICENEPSWILCHSRQNKTEQKPYLNFSIMSAARSRPRSICELFFNAC